MGYCKVNFYLSDEYFYCLHLLFVGCGAFDAPPINMFNSRDVVGAVPYKWLNFVVFM